jgi:TfoX/Sxy family transcriptional regulator of competence genes
MAFDEKLAERIRRRLARRKGVVEKKMFGGVGFMLNDRLAVGVWKDSLIVRISPEDGDDAIKEPHVRPFDIARRPMKGWIMVGPDGLTDDRQLGAWIQQATKFVSGLPAR